MPCQLVPAADNAQPIRLDKAVVLFGRHPDCDIVITSSRKVSRKHCCLAQVNDTFVVRDLGSMNGVRINGSAVRRSGRLRPGDKLAVGDVVFHLREEGKVPGAPRPQATSPKPAPEEMISQDVPVVIPEEEVEESVVKSPTDSDLPIELSAEDMIDDDSEWDVDSPG